MGNLLQGSARGLVAPPSSALATMPRSAAGLVATNAQLFFVAGHRPRAWSAPHSSSSRGAQTRSFSSKKRSLGALGPEVSMLQASRARPEPSAPRRFSHHPESDDSCDDPVAQATLRWVRSTVVGLNLCPWAGGALMGGRMQVVVHPPLPLPPPAGAAAAGTAHTVSDDGERDSSHGEEGDFLLEGLVRVAAREATALGGLEGDAAVNATTLVVARPSVAEDFEDFLDAVGAVDDFLDDSGLRGTVQLATFHPQYRFEGSDEDDASNYTNRSPYPVLHLLLEDQVSAAVSQVGDPEKVWQRNVDTTRKLGVEAMRQGVEACLRAPAVKEGDGENQR